MPTTQGQIRTPTNWCTNGPRVDTLSAVFVVLLRDHFDQLVNGITPAAEIEHAQAQTRVWVAGNQTKIRIEDATQWFPEAGEQMPALTAERLGVKKLTLGIGDYEGYDLETGETQYRAFYTGRSRVLCSSSVPGEAEVLGGEVFRFLTHWAPLIRHELSFDRFLVHEAGPCQQLKKPDDRWAVGVDVSYVWNEAWTLTPATLHPLEILALNLEFEPYDQDGPPA